LTFLSSFAAIDAVRRQIIGQQVGIACAPRGHTPEAAQTLPSPMGTSKVAEPHLLMRVCSPAGFRR
jgi:hypothetical protein